MKNAIYTQSSGEIFNTIAEIAVPTMKAYADRIGAEFIYDRQDKAPKRPLFGKYKVYDLLADFDRVLFLDVDLLVRPDSPNIFDIVPEDRFAAFNEGSWCYELNELKCRASFLYQVGEAMKLDPTSVDLSSSYVNAGVFVANKSHRDLFAMPEDGEHLSLLLAEQSVLNLRLHHAGIKPYFLPVCFNAMPWRWPTMRLDDNYFVHYAGMRYDERYTAMMKDVAEMRERFTLPSKN